MFSLQSLADPEETIERESCFFNNLLGLEGRESDQDLPPVEAW